MQTPLEGNRDISGGAREAEGYFRGSSEDGTTAFYFLIFNLVFFYVIDLDSF